MQELMLQLVLPRGLSTRSCSVDSVECRFCLHRGSPGTEACTRSLISDGWLCNLRGKQRLQLCLQLFLCELRYTCLCPWFSPGCVKLSGRCSVQHQHVPSTARELRKQRCLPSRVRKSFICALLLIVSHPWGLFWTVLLLSGNAMRLEKQPTCASRPNRFACRLSRSVRDT